MIKWLVENAISGIVLGEYEGETEADALDALAQDAGYADFAAAREVAPDDGGLLVTRV